MKAKNHQKPPGGQPVTEARPLRKVLLVEHQPDQRETLASQMRSANYQVLTTDCPDEALRLCAEFQPDLVLYGWLMPHMDGAGFCRAFRRLDASSQGYLVLLAPYDRGEDIEHGLEAGADDFVTLPISRTKLLARLGVADRVLRVEAELRASNTQLRTALDRLQQTQAAIDRDLREARKLQQGLVRERGGQFGPLQISLLLRPAGHIGGDLVGFFPIGEDRIGLYALDVSGHGVTAALLAAQLSVHLSGSSEQNVALRAAQAGSDAVTPAALAHFFNNMMLEEMSTDTYFTMIYAELNHVTGEAHIVQAGHPHPMLQRPDGTVTPLGRGGMPIGVFENPVFDEISLVLQPGDRLLITSDGVSEASNPAGRLLGDDGLEAIMRTNAFLGGHAFLESMAWSVTGYCDGERPDDMSAVLIEYLGDDQPISLRH